MKTLKRISSAIAFTSVDLILMIAGAVICASILPPMLARPKVSCCRINCLSNLKQVGVGFRLYASDGGPYPGYDSTNEAWQYFQVVGNEIGSPKVLLCPQDQSRWKGAYAFDFANPPGTNSFSHPQFQNKALSYFYGADANEENPGSILAGDRNLTLGMKMTSGTLILKSNGLARWAQDIHTNTGNITFGDGSAQRMTTSQLRKTLASVTNETQRIVLP